MCKEILVIVLISFVINISCAQIKSEEGLNVSYDLGNKTSFKTLIGGNIAHSGEKMGVWAANRFDPIKNLGIYSLRTHDARSLDWDRIFPDWNADPNNEKSYDFEKSDRIINFMISQGFKPFLRLGVSVSAVSLKRKIGLNPPDSKKWATIAAHIIKHYKSNWANGYSYPIEYVEIWNEPDIKFWGGTRQDFYNLASESVSTLKREFPNLKVGLCGIANLQKAQNFTEGLLKYLSDPNLDGNTNDRINFDFFSWHVYEMGKGLMLFKEFATLSRNLLNKYGYTSVQSFCTEWNASLPSNYLQSNDAAIDITSTLIWSENNKVDGIYFYPLVDKWGLFHTDKALTSNDIGVFQWTNLSKAFKLYNDFKTQTPYKLPSQSKNVSNISQIIGATTKSGTLTQFLISSKSHYTTNAVISLKDFPFATSKIQVFVQRDIGLFPVKKDNLFRSKSGSLTVNASIPSNAVVLIKIEN